MSKWRTQNDAETIFERLEQHGKTWKVYVAPPMPVSFHGIIHASRLQDRFATNFVPFSEFERDVAAGTLPDFALIEPNMLGGHGDYHPACGRSFVGHNFEIGVDPPSSILAGESFLERLFSIYQSASSESGSNVWNTTLLIGWDEPGGTYDHVPPGPVPPPDPAAPAGEFGFKFDRSGYRVPAILVSPWVEQGSVFNDEYRHTSLIATLRKIWNLGEAFTERDASARTFDHLLNLEAPRDPQTWATITALPVPEWHMDEVVVGKALSTLGRAAGGALFHNAQEAGIPVPPELTDPTKEPAPQDIVPALRDIAAHIFPRLAMNTPTVT
jgi:phospholipase C